MEAQNGSQMDAQIGQQWNHHDDVMMQQRPMRQPVDLDNNNFMMDQNGGRTEGAHYNQSGFEYVNDSQENGEMPQHYDHIQPRY